MEYWKNNKDKNINKIENILDDEEKFATLISPCYGNPNNRDVLSGGWIDRNLFQKYNEYVKADNGELYIRGGPRFHIALDNLRVKAYNDLWRVMPWVKCCYKGISNGFKI